MHIEIYSDGSGTTKDKVAGTGWVMVLDGQKHSEGNGHLAHGSNNDAEMEAAIQGLKAVLAKVVLLKSVMPDERIEVTLCSDSQITLGWADGTYRFKQESKYARFEILKELMKRLGAKTRWVRGHSGDVYNERCDVLANLGRHRLGPEDLLPKKQKMSKKTMSMNTAKLEIATLKTALARYQMAIQFVRPSLVMSVEIRMDDIIEGRHKF